MNEKRRKRILVVDDDPDILEQVALELRQEGYQVTEAGGQTEAEKVLEKGNPDLAVVDLMMENMDSGFVLTHYLKNLYPDTPVVLLTAVTAATGMSFAASSDEARSWVKADLVLDKPVRPEQIKAEVRRLLRVAEPSAAPHAHH